MPSCVTGPTSSLVVAQFTVSVFLDEGTSTCLSSCLGTCPNKPCLTQTSIASTDLLSPLLCNAGVKDSEYLISLS